MLLHTVAPLSKRLPFSKGGARSARAVREAARSKPSKARSVASEPCERREATMPHCGMLSAKLTEGLSCVAAVCWQGEPSGHYSCPIRRRDGCAFSESGASSPFK